MSKATDDLLLNMHQVLDYTNGFFNDQLELIATTLFSCIELGNRIVVCSTYNNVGISDLFVHSLNSSMIKRTKNISSYSLNSDSNYLSLLAKTSGSDFFAKMYKMVSKNGDILLLLPGKSPVADDKTKIALTTLIQEAKNDGNMIICINNLEDDSYITKILSQEDLCLNFNITEDDDVSLLLLMYMFQHIMRIIKQLASD